MIACPPKHSSEYKALLNALGSDKSVLQVWANNDFTLPTVPVALNIINNGIKKSMEVNDINQIKNYTKIKDDIDDFENYSNENRRNFIVTEAIANNGNYTGYWRNYDFVELGLMKLGDTEANPKLIEYINQNILPQYKEFDNKAKQVIIDVWNERGLSAEEKTGRINEILGEKFIEVDTVKYLDKLIGKNQGIALLSDVQTLGLKSIPKEFIGTNPLVVLKSGFGTDKPIISVIDVARDNIQDKVFNDTIFSNFITLNKAKEKGSILNSSEQDNRKLLTGLSMMALKSANADLGVHHLTIFQTKFGKTAAPQFFMDEIFPTIELMKTIPVIYESLSDNIKGLINNKELFTAKYTYSYLNALYEHIKAYSEDTEYNRNFTDFIDRFNTDKIDKYRMLGYIRSRIKKLTEDYKLLNTDINNFEELYLLSQAAFYLKEGENRKISLNTFERESSLGKWVTNVPYTKNPALQYAFKEFKDATMRIGENLKKFQDSFGKVTEPVIKQYNKIYGLQAYATDIGSKYFKDMFVTKEVIDKKTGKLVEVYLPYLKKTGDPKKDALYEKVMDTIEKYLIKLRMHENRFTDGFNEDKAKLMVKAQWDRSSGKVPVMSKGFMELITKKKGWSNMWEGLTKGTVVYEDNPELTDREVKRGTIDWFFEEQFNSIYDVKLGRIGIETKNGKMILVDKEMNETMTTNIENMMNLFVHTIESKIEHENRSLPARKEAELMLWGYDLLKGREFDSERKWLDQYADRLISKKGVQPDNTKIDQTGHAMGRMILNATTVTGLAFNVNTAIAAAVNNGMLLWTNAFASSFINHDTIYGLKEAGQAFRMYHTYTGENSSWKKIRSISVFHQFVEQEERDLLNSQRHVKTKKVFFSQENAHFMNRMVDLRTREMVMTAQMLKDGTFDAYNYNKGELKYNYKNDKRFGYWEGTTWKQTPEQKLLLNALVDRLIADGVLKGGKYEAIYENIDRAYSYEDIRGIQQIANKWIMGTYDEKNQGRYKDYIMGAFAYKFKKYLVDMLNNKFNWSTITSQEGGRDVIKYVEEINPATKEITMMPIVEREYPLYEGQFKSFFLYYKDILEEFKGDSDGAFNSIFAGTAAVIQSLNPLSKTRKKAFDKLHTDRKFNIARLQTELALFLVMIILWNLAIDEGDDKNKKEKDKDIGILKKNRLLLSIKYGIKDMISWNPLALIAIAGSPIQGFMQIKALFDILTWQDPSTQNIKKVVPLYSTIQSAKELIPQDEIAGMISSD